MLRSVCAGALLSDANGARFLAFDAASVNLSFVRDAPRQRRGDGDRVDGLGIALLFLLITTCCIAFIMFRL
jgi:hypothetical protein